MPINGLEVLRGLTLVLLREIEAWSESLGLRNEGRVDLGEEVRKFEAGLIRCALIQTGGGQRRAARLLNMKVSTLNAKIKRYRLDQDELVIRASGTRQRRS